MSRSAETSPDFDFEAGARVRVRVREHGTSGTIQAKFEAEVTGFREGVGPSSDHVCLDPPWNSISGVTLRPTEAEFEVLSDD